ncbi:sensor histidine kinase [Rhodococcus sp. AD45-ID]|uniref:sensor histidine kinase n=1 Tax=unclassified Rhodococcus (in: high G+C Gram-positive bacteria) TaxID=192944 RepID=UPI0005D3C473|nr:MULTISPECIES: sensor histidine kinase [unclassified Rhodococcus (in: high G+C Gram-positive bacteria)]KJF24996.1 Sensor protein vraS [Rhodococcus sp. AD45]PSR43213.1 sensor histidine kinase [Rhodococcus sp. AD45-ID]RZL26644.1 MAG: sensor histidine kinase [Rhodococcus sp. (in: high G+C Gram-positive bacteria)]
MDGAAPNLVKLGEMHRSPLTPVFAGLQLGLHILVVALAGVVFLRAIVDETAATPYIIALTVIFTAIYLFGVVKRLRGNAARWWLALLSLVWVVLMALSAEAAYLVFGLFFLYVHLLRRPWSLVAVVTATSVAVIGTGLHRGWSIAGAIGPMIGAAVAVAIGLGYQALYREAAERGRLIDELMNTREELASTSRDAGKLAERERLAAEIHDTVAQGLSSIQMLLHAAERADPNSPAVRQISLAREAAADSLAETRQLIAELTPAALDGQSLSDALGRICERASSAHIEARAVVEGEPIALPMPLEATLVRIAQGAVANVLRHAHATRMAVTLTYSTDTVSLDIVDNGVGFDISVLDRGPAESFGLNAIRRRVQLQGGTFDIESEPGHTAVTVTFPLEIGDE